MYIVFTETNLIYIQNSLSQKLFILSLYLFVCMIIENPI